jgi:hypothetical protein
MRGILQEGIMRCARNCLVTTSLVVLIALAAMQAKADNIEATSTVDTVTVYPDGASVTRAINVDVPAGDNTVVLKDFPLTLDPSSLRVEGEAMPGLRSVPSIHGRPVPPRRSICPNSTSASRR